MGCVCEGVNTPRIDVLLMVKTRAASNFTEVEHSVVVVEFHLKLPVKTLFGHKGPNVSGWKLDTSTVVGNH